MDSIRIDKWLWAARFFKTSSVAQEAVGLGRVLLGGARVKASRDVKVGDKLEIRRGDEVFTVYVEGLSSTRGPAPVAQKLYRETDESRAAREAQAARRKMAPEPAMTIRGGRPTKAEGRALRRATSWDDEGFEGDFDWED